MEREDLKSMILNHFLKNPNTSAKPVIDMGDNMGAGTRGQIAGLICVLRDNKTLKDTGGTMSDVYLTVDNEVIKKLEKSKNE